MNLKESREHGTLSWDIFKAFAKSAGGGLTVCVVVLVVLQKVSSNLGDLWLAHWVSGTPTNSNSTSPEDTFNLKVYAGLAAANSAVVLVLVFLFAYGCLKAARIIHERMLRKVFAVCICLVYRFNSLFN